MVEVLPTIPTWLEMPSATKVNVTAPHATDEDVRGLLSRCPERLESLGLRGTPVTDAILAELERFPGLRDLDAVRTKISTDALHAFAARRPGFRCFPAPPQPAP